MIESHAMLESLRDLPRSDAEDALAGALDAFLPNAQPITLNEVQRKLVSEARALAGHGGDDAAARRLGEELANLLLPPAEEEAAKDRLGHRGELSFSQYHIEFSDLWSKQGAFLGVTIDEAIDAFTHAWHAETIFFNDDFDPSSTSFQSYVIVAGRSRAPGSVLLLLVSTRGAVATIDSAWRLFDDEVGLPPKASPKTMLERFVARYGVEFGFGVDQRKRRWVWQETVPVGGEHQTHKLGANSFQAIAATRRMPDLRTVRVYVALCIDTTRYSGSMRKHGLAV
jgi:hypothetical protein